jgi:hypothetical protein
VEELDAVNNPEDAAMGTRKEPFARELWFEQADFMENPPKKYFRLAPGAEVRVRWSYIIKCTGVVKNERGEVVELHCTYDPATRGGDSPDGRKVKSTMHWVSAPHARQAGTGTGCAGCPSGARGGGAAFDLDALDSRSVHPRASGHAVGGREQELGAERRQQVPPLAQGRAGPSRREDRPGV